MGDVSNDIKVECCECGHVHMESERPEGEPDAIGIRDMLCPSCGHHEYYRLDETGGTCTSGMCELGADEE